MVSLFLETVIYKIRYQRERFAISARWRIFESTWQDVLESSVWKDENIRVVQFLIGSLK